MRFGFKIAGIVGIVLVAMLAGCSAPGGRPHLPVQYSLLGQLQTVAPEHLKDFLLILVSGVACWSSYTASANARRTQRREVSLVDSFVTTEFCAKQHEKSDEAIALDRANLRIDVDKIYTEIHRVGDMATAHNAKLEIFGQRIKEIDMKIDRSLAGKNGGVMYD